MHDSVQEIAAIFHALSDPNRVHIMKLLAEGEKCACTLLEELDISQPTLSYHMRLLCGCGLVKSRKTGTWVHYSVSEDGLRLANDFLKYVMQPLSADERI